MDTTYWPATTGNGITIDEVLSWVRPHLLALKPYSSARDEFSGEAQVFLDANENAFGPVGISGNWHRYPDPHHAALKQQIGNLKGMDPSQIFIGNGSDEAIDLLYRCFCEPGVHKALLLPPTYGMYQVSAGINGVEKVSVVLDNAYQPQVERVLAKAQQDPAIRLLFLCSPNNPTANLISPASILSILAGFKGIIVLDEAYIDYCQEATGLPLLAQFPNLVVVQTLSKAWGLAALRVGMAFAHPAIISLLNKVKPPYNLAGPTQELALAALANVERKNEGVQSTLTLRASLLLSLGSLPMVERLYPTDANFVLVRLKATHNASEVYHKLTAMGIVVRDRSSQPGCANCLRITVGTEAENPKLLAGLLTI